MDTENEQILLNSLSDICQELKVANLLKAYALLKQNYSQQTAEDLEKLLKGYAQPLRPFWNKYGERDGYKP